MKFDSLSDAIRYYAYAPNLLSDLGPYSSLSVQIAQVPGNINNITPESPQILTYGRTVWGVGRVIDINEPIV